MLCTSGNGVNASHGALRRSFGVNALHGQVKN